VNHGDLPRPYKMPPTKIGGKSVLTTGHRRLPLRMELVMLLGVCYPFAVEIAEGCRAGSAY
jgi:hypothetical protein